ncbi:PEP-CTERM sorting domain-containing protein [Aeoliella sp. ICT_H6.2]|uniref:PEP-CTERM sorting domain-containing protein n=1 Tax=Aeoliella straminimaris TaxID=2954799 RepID=A0A9X2FH62_9BACT|nr:PEP-CTERM sorting domain-containing protein [Aeoliella straminimaris]
MKVSAATITRLITLVVVLPLAAMVQGQTLTMDNVFMDDLGYPNASAKLTYTLANGSTDVEIDVSNAVPNQFWSIWMKLDGISPLTGIDVVPFAGVSDIPSMAASTPDSALTPTAKSLGLVGDDGSGSTSGPNGFFTDANGDAAFSITLDYPLVEGGVLPFDQFDASLSPVPLGSTPFLLNTLIHTDQLGYGLMPDGGPGTAAAWFWTSNYAVPEPSSVFLLGTTCIGALVCWRRKPRKAAH